MRASRIKAVPKGTWGVDVRYVQMGDFLRDTRLYWTRTLPAGALLDWDFAEPDGTLLGL